MIKKISNKIYLISEVYGNKLGLDLPYFVKNGFWILFRQIIGTCAGLVLLVVFARLTTHEVFGQYQFVISILAVISIFSLPGLNVSVLRSTARGNDGDYKNAVFKSFLWSLIGIPFLLLLGTYYYLIENHALGFSLMLSALFFPFFYSLNTWDSFLQGKKRFDIAAKYSFVQTIVNTVATCFVLFSERNNLIMIVGVYLFSYTIFNAFYYWKSLRYVENDKIETDTVSYGFFLTKISVLSQVGDNLDKIILGLFSVQNLAVYSVSLRLLEYIKNFFKVLLGITLPKYSHEKIKTSIKIFCLFSIAAVIISLTLFYFSKEIIFFLYGESYDGAVSLFRILLIAAPFTIINSLFGYEFLGKKKLKILTYLSIVPNSIKILLVLFVTILYNGGLSAAMLAWIVVIYHVANFVISLVGKFITSD